MDDGEKRFDDIFQSKDFIGAWLKRVALEITSDKENVDQNIVETIQTVAPHGSMQTLMNLILAIIAENKQDKFSLRSQEQDNQLFLDCPDQKNGYCLPLGTTEKHQMRLEAQRKEVTHGSTQTLMNLILAIIAENKQDKFSLRSQEQDNQLFSDCLDQKNGYCLPLGTTEKCQMCLEAQRKEVTITRSEECLVLLLVIIEFWKKTRSFTIIFKTSKW